jgi:hypothetical protein
MLEVITYIFAIQRKRNFYFVSSKNGPLNFKWAIFSFYLE